MSASMRSSAIVVAVAAAAALAIWALARLAGVDLIGMHLAVGYVLIAGFAKLVPRQAS
jgi:hypothetical protein